MAQKAAKVTEYTERNVLLAIFRPKSHPVPGKVRKTTVKASKGRKQSRVTAYNQMSGLSQEILRRSGKRDSYLKGEVSLAEAKASLRDKAVSLNIAKPLKSKAGKVAPVATLDRDAIASKTYYTLRRYGGNNLRQPPNITSIRQRYLLLSDQELADLKDADIDYLRNAASDPEKKRTYTEGDEIREVNPYWYH